MARQRTFIALLVVLVLPWLSPFATGCGKRSAEAQGIESGKIYRLLSVEADTSNIGYLIFRCADGQRNQYAVRIWQMNRKVDDRLLRGTVRFRLWSEEGLLATYNGPPNPPMALP